MRILQFTAENFKKIRVVEITPKGTITTVTGRNGQGKTSVLDALWALFGGRRAIPEKPVRRGAEKSKLSATISDEHGRPYLIAKRVIAGDRTTTLTIEAAPGAQRPAGTPQAVLDALIGEMSFDPIAFIHLETKKQVEILRSIVKLDVDLDKMNAETAQNYAERTIVNRRAADLKAQAAAATYSPGLPKEKIDESEILQRIEAANKENQQLAEKIQLRARLEKDYNDAVDRESDHVRLIEEKTQLMQTLERNILENATAQAWALEVANTISEKIVSTSGDIRTEWTRDFYLHMGAAQRAIDQLAQERGQAKKAFAEQLENTQKTVKEAWDTIDMVRQRVTDADQAFQNAPAATLIDTTGLMKELEQARLTNREIDRRTRSQELEEQWQQAEREAAALTRAMDSREEKKREALANAKMPIEGLTFDEATVWYRGIPIEQLGEAEQIRIGCALAMAANPQLRCIPIAHGESLDNESLKLIDDMAAEHDFQIFIARVDTSGKVGIVLEDGMVIARNEEA